MMLDLDLRRNSYGKLSFGGQANPETREPISNKPLLRDSRKILNKVEPSESLKFVNVKP